MSRSSISPEEMMKRRDVDYNAMLQMIGEGSPVFESYSYRDDDVFERKEPEELESGDENNDAENLPETYQ